MAESCIDNIRNWMSTNFLNLNSDKTEFIIFGNRNAVQQFNHISLKVGNQVIKPADQVRNLGIIFDSSLGMDNHINSVRRNTSIQIQQHWSLIPIYIRKCLNQSIPKQTKPNLLTNKMLVWTLANSVNKKGTTKPSIEG